MPLQKAPVRDLENDPAAERLLAAGRAALEREEAPPQMKAPERPPQQTNEPIIPQTVMSALTSHATAISGMMTDVHGAIRALSAGPAPQQLLDALRELQELYAEVIDAQGTCLGYTQVWLYDFIGYDAEEGGD